MAIIEMENGCLTSDSIAALVSAFVEAGFDADSIKGIIRRGRDCFIDVDCDLGEVQESGGFDERMDMAAEEIGAHLRELGFVNASVARGVDGHSFVVTFEKEEGEGGMNKICKLRDYLANTDTQDALDLVVRIAPKKSDIFYDIMVDLGVIGMLAKDVHYRAKGSAFYSNHELADFVHQTEWKFDDLSEIYFMGEKQSLPPLRAKVCADASRKVVDNFYSQPTELALTQALHTALLGLVGKIEIAKAEQNPSSGVAAVLDDIAKESLKGAGLLKRRLEQTAE